MTITHHLPAAVIASFASLADQAQWLGANPRWQLLGRIIRPQSAKGETFAVLVEHASLEQAASANLAELHAERAARARYHESLKSPQSVAERQRRRIELRWDRTPR